MPRRPCRGPRIPRDEYGSGRASAPTMHRREPRSATTRSVTNDPFKGMPLFGDLAKMFQQLQQQGPVSWDAGRQLALSIATDGQPEPNVDPLERIRSRSWPAWPSCRSPAAPGSTPRSAVRASASCRSPAASGRSRTLDAYRPLFEELAGSLQNDRTRRPPTPARRRSARVDGSAHADDRADDARHDGGQHGRPPRPALARPVRPARSRARAATSCSSSRPTSTRSATHGACRSTTCGCGCASTTSRHHAVLGVPHVRARLDSLLHRYLAGFEASDSPARGPPAGARRAATRRRMPDLQSLFGDPEALLGAIQSPTTARAAPTARGDRRRDRRLRRPRHGHDRRRPAAELLDAHRGGPPPTGRGRPSDRFVERLFGLELTQAQYDRGAAFVAGVVERAGDAGLARSGRASATCRRRPRSTHPACGSPASTCPTSERRVHVSAVRIRRGVARLPVGRVGVAPGRLGIHLACRRGRRPRRWGRGAAPVCSTTGGAHGGDVDGASGVGRPRRAEGLATRTRAAVPSRRLRGGGRRPTRRCRSSGGGRAGRGRNRRW